MEVLQIGLLQITWFIFETENVLKEQSEMEANRSHQIQTNWNGLHSLTFPNPTNTW